MFLTALAAALLLVPAARAAAAALTINFEGSGSGTVTGSGIDFGTFEERTVNCSGPPPVGECKAEYSGGFEGTFFATADVGSEFTGWTGGGENEPNCKEPSAQECTLLVLANATLTAHFSSGPPKFKLKVTKSGTGTGKVTSSPAGIDCGSTCEAEFEEGKEVELSQTASAGSEFKEWTGGACSGSGACKVTMSAAKEVGAKFDLIPRTFSAPKNGTGTGTVECEDNGGGLGPCAGSYPSGHTIKVVATPNAGSEFKGFSAGTGSASSCTTSPCTFTIEANSSVTSTFDLISRTLSIPKAGTGTGTVQCEVNGGGPEACAASYPNGTSVKLKATANGGSEFAGYSGDCFGLTCELTMNANKSVTATFNLVGEKSLSIAKNGTGTGTVQCEVNGGGAEACAASYPEGTSVKLKATASGGSEFKGFSGDCTGATCELTMSANKSVTATFDLIPRTLSVTNAGTGTGEVKCKISGGSLEACPSSVPNGKSVEVVAIVSAGSEFKGFSAGTGSAASCSTSPCSFTIEANSSLTATFDLAPRTLGIASAGSGTGTVKCKVNGGGEEACAASYPNGTSLQLVASASAGSEFAGFSAGTGSAASCSTSPCSFTVSANSTVTATFNLIPRTLSTTNAGTGTGTVKCKIAGGSEEACPATVPNGKSVQVIATPSAGSEFKGFSAGTGSASSCTTSPCSFTIEANSSLTATFDLIQRTLTITKAGTGTGEVKCKVGAGPEEACAASYPNGSSVKVIATPSAGSELSGFSGACVGASCSLTMNANKSVTVTFNLIPRTLTVSKAGSGSGSVTCNGGACAASYPDGTKVTLAATAASGSTFAGFSGGGCSGTGNCVITLNANTTVTATFDLQSSGGGGGGGTPPPPPPPPGEEKPKPLKCKKGFKKKTVKGKAKCVKVKKHKKHRHH